MLSTDNLITMSEFKKILSDKDYKINYFDIKRTEDYVQYKITINLKNKTLGNWSSAKIDGPNITMSFNIPSVMKDLDKAEIIDYRKIKENNIEYNLLSSEKQKEYLKEELSKLVKDKGKKYIILPGTYSGHAMFFTVLYNNMYHDITIFEPDDRGWQEIVIHENYYYRIDSGYNEEKFDELIKHFLK